MEKTERAVTMNLPALPTWLQWLLLLAVIWLYIQVNMLQASMGGGQRSFHSRQDLEAAYTKGTISRDEYERLKGRLS